MNEISITNWPGVRQLHDGKFSFYFNLANRTYIEGEYPDAESAARGLDEVKYAFVQSGHISRANRYNFPVEVSKWQSGEVIAPQPTSALLQFMAANPPRYLPLAQRLAVDAQKKLAKEQKTAVKEKKALTADLPTPVKIFSAHQTVAKLLLATPSRLTDDQRIACQTVLELLAVLRDE